MATLCTISRITICTMTIPLKGCGTFVRCVFTYLQRPCRRGSTHLPEGLHSYFEGHSTCTLSRSRGSNGQVGFTSVFSRLGASFQTVSRANPFQSSREEIRDQFI